MKLIPLFLIVWKTVILEDLKFDTESSVYSNNSVTVYIMIFVQLS
jgi:hypothetical protein